MFDADINREDTIIRRAEERGHADHGWLKSAHSFSFAGYHDPDWMGFGPLRVINDDQVAGGAGFPMHPHADFEIFSYVLEGKLEHKDSMGNGSVVKAGGVQYMTAGTGVRHSEFNPDTENPVKFLQIWMVPEESGAKPGYQTLDIPPAEKDGKLRLFISKDGREGSIKTLAPAEVYAAHMTEGQETRFTLPEGRKAYIHLAEGSAQVNGERLWRGDAIALSAPGEVTLSGGEEAEVLLFDLKA
ncbi:pirin family protein [Parvularcula sp. ZS-1/3]|uniref:Pirin family protein n=1 Tax=Parvularcula mediterranea TaxID=2732508 RepID=A0A7Y3RPX1_9PROT|nr:pirin family protein [Parvularcula mediterranea]NNU17202.1 pirin family protein [Parvularcula mediterranea]